MKKWIVAALVSVLVEPTLAVQTFTSDDDQKALERGKAAQNVVTIKIISPDKIVETAGTGILVRPDLIATCAHLFEDFEDVIQPGVPYKIRGYVDFRADTTKPPKKKSKKVFEFESIITHPGSDLDDDNIGADFAFIKLKKPVKGIKPAMLYKDGLLSPAQLQTNISSSYEPGNAIEATFTGYGYSLTEVFGRRRSIQQICILDRSDDEDEVGTSGTALSGFVPPTNLDDLSVDTDNAFVRSLFNKFPDDVFGMLWRGDSGGPVTIEADGVQYLLGVESNGDISHNGENQRDIKTFEQSGQLRNHYLTKFTALFNAEGKQHPVIQDMIEKLDDFPISQKSRLKKIIKLDRKQEKAAKVLIKKVEADIATLSGLLRDDLSFKQFKKALRAIGFTDLDVKNKEFRSYFGKKSKVLKTDKAEELKKRVVKVIERLQHFLDEESE